MLDFIKSQLIHKTEFDNRDDKKEFEEVRLLYNIQRSKRAGVGLLALNLALILVDLFVYEPMRAEVPAYVLLYYSHLAVLLFIVLWFGLFKISSRYDNIIRRNIYSMLIYIALCWCIFMALNNMSISGQISAYIICVLAVASYFYMDRKESLITIGLSLAVFAIGLSFFTKSTEAFYGYLINSSIVAFISIIVSNLNYNNFAKDFLYKKSILKSKNELEATNKKLQEYEGQRTEFVANISHELRTPLNVIYSAEQLLDIVIKQDDSREKADKYLKMIKQNSYRLLRLINNLIDITKIENTKFEVKLVNADIVKVIEDITMSVIEYVESKGINLTFDTEVEEKVIACDPDKIERIILNLLSNAVKFTEKDGDIFVSISAGGGNVYISVKDTGEGIPEGIKDSVFDRFVQVDGASGKKSQGSGIGLALVKNMVEMHGGSITVNSRLGEGSEFLISLPDKVLEGIQNQVQNMEVKNDYIQKIHIEFADIYE